MQAWLDTKLTSPLPKSQGILGLNSPPSGFPYNRSYNSYLSELQFFRLQPTYGQLPKRLPISEYVPVCPTVRGLLQIVLSVESFTAV
jgi:hypothetical protein